MAKVQFIGGGGTTSPSGVAGAIQFSNGSAFSSDATNFFWDDTNNRLGIGINTLRTALDIYNYAIPPIITVSSQKAFDVAGTLIGGIQAIQHTTLTAPSGAMYFKSETGNAAQGKITFETGSALGSSSEKMSIGFNGAVGIGITAPTARLNVKGSGTTSATSSFRAENSAGTSLIDFRDDGLLQFAIPGGNSSLSGLQLTTYYVRSSNGSSFINIDGGNMLLYNGSGALGLNLVAASSRLVQPTTIGSNTAPVASAMLEVISTTQGLLPPRMTTIQKNAIATPATGLIVYDTTLLSFYQYNGTAWVVVGENSTQSFVIACSDETTAITTGTAKVTFRIPYAFTLTSVRASLTTAQTSGTIFTVDINENGTSILSTKLTIDNTEKTSTTAATPPVISDLLLADDSEITIDVDQIGDGTAKGLKVVLIGYKS